MCVELIKITERMHNVTAARGGLVVINIRERQEGRIPHATSHVRRLSVSFPFRSDGARTAATADRLGMMPPELAVTGRHWSLH